MQLFLAVIAVAVVLCEAQVSNPCPGVGSRYIGFSLSGYCPPGTTNVKNFCCTLPTTETCPGGETPLGPCVGGDCVLGYACNTASNQCCPSTTTPTPACLNPIGPCVEGKCSVGYVCDTASNRCCQSTTEVGTTKPTPKPSTSCPAGTTFTGPSISGLCPPSNTFVNNICCATA
uniref:CC domain-containing protein n=1 Tax=Plectus sambesii TaxID=2011161 RepID=A0A914W9Y4_9BILA